MISVKDILITPETFFGELCKKEVNLGMPVLIILLTGIISGISAFIIAGKTAAAFIPEGMEGIAVIASAIGFVGGLIGTFIYWLIWIIAFLIMLYILKGQIPFKRLAEIVGYGFIPQIFGGIVGVAIIMTSLPELVVRSAIDPQAIELAVKEFSMSAPMMAVSFISIIFTLWSANIWLFGIKECSGIEFKKAALCVGIPLIIYVVLSVGSLYM